MTLTLVKPILKACLISEDTPSNDMPLTVTHITDDSREVKPGSLFVCFSGPTLGLNHLHQACSLGASRFIISPEVAAVISKTPDMNLLQTKLWISPHPRRSFSYLSSLMWPRQPGLRLAVTGTNGKSSVVHWTTQILNSLGQSCIGLGTLGISGSYSASPEAMPPMPCLTTPGAAWLHPFLHHQKTSAFMCEVSSHALDQERLAGFKFHGAVWTTFSPEHLDYHRSMHTYFQAKLRLFTQRLVPQGLAILADDLPAEVYSQCRRHNVEVTTYGTSPQATLMFRYERRENLDVIMLPQHNLDFIFPFPGNFQRSNFIGVATLLQALGYPLQQVIKCIPCLTHVPGRLEHVATYHQANIYIDYAHTPSGLEASLKSLRSLTPQKLGVVIGCGGQRDNHKRYDMGRIADEKADWCVITDDNPRFEDPHFIRQVLKKGAPQAYEIPDRRQAISYALAQLKSGDILLVAGKGHETVQEVQGRRLPFHDATEILNLIHQANALTDTSHVS